jgi:multiple sugar transport system ATP-binding protein
MGGIRLEGVAKTYPGGHVAVRGVDLDVPDGEFVVLVGPSGCGKSTLLRLIAGLESPTAGRIWIGDRDVTALPPQERDIAMVFQSYALYPHKTVRENLAFPLQMRHTSPDEIARRVTATAAMLGLDPILERRPRQLSGGQRQRVALGRAMVREPQAFLLDEPLSNLDAQLRVQTRSELARMHRRLRATMLHVTHDQEEAMTLGDRIALLHEGVLQQVAPPLEAYRRPANTFVAGFVGSPAMNFFPGTIAPGDGGTPTLQGPGFTVPLPDAPALPRRADLLLGVRPSDIVVTGPGRGDVVGRVDVIETLGNAVLLQVALAGEPRRDPVRVVASPDSAWSEGDAVGLEFRRDRLHVFERDTGRRVN